MVPEGKEPKITGSVLYTTVNSIWGWKDEFRMPHTYLLTIKGQNKKKGFHAWGHYEDLRKNDDFPHSSTIKSKIFK